MSGENNEIRHMNKLWKNPANSLQISISGNMNKEGQ